MSNVNDRAVEVLVRTDMQSLTEYVQAKDRSIIRMSDGTPPTAEELTLIMQSSPDDFQAAADFMERNASLQMERHKRRMRLVELVSSNARHPDETTEEIVEHMSSEDHHEFLDLLDAML